MKTYTLQDTKLEPLKRVVDRNGNWERYALQVKNKDVLSTVYLDGSTTILNKGYPKGSFFEDWLAKHTEEERQAILSETSDRGDMVHRSIDLLLSGDGEVTLDRETQVFSRANEQEMHLDNRAWDCLLSFQRFWEAHDPILYVSEAPLFNVKDGYAGTADAVLQLTKACDVKSCCCNELVGQVGVWDWKTAKAIYPNYAAQIASYAKGQNMSMYAPEPTYGAALLLGTKHKTTGGYAFQAWVGDDLEAAYGDFLAAKRLAAIPPFDPNKEIKDIPSSITLAVTRYVPPQEPEIVPEDTQEPAEDNASQDATEESEPTINT